MPVYLGGRGARGSGVQGTGSREAIAIIVLTILAEAGFRYRNESMGRVAALKGRLLSKVVNHRAGRFIPCWRPCAAVTGSHERDARASDDFVVHAGRDEPVNANGLRDVLQGLLAQGF